MANEMEIETKRMLKNIDKSLDMYEGEVDCLPYKWH